MIAYYAWLRPGDMETADNLRGQSPKDSTFRISDNGIEALADLEEDTNADNYTLWILGKHDGCDIGLQHHHHEGEEEGRPVQ